MKNLFIIPTNKLSKIGFDSVKNLHFVNFLIDDYQNIYITSDEEIKEGDWYLYCNQINKRTRKNPKAEYPYPSYQKILLTTDQDLIKDGVQAIDNEFLEWFVKNQNCEFVKVEVDLSKHNGQFQTKYGYKIIIPKEEPKQDFIFSQLEVGKEYKQEVFELGEELERGITITYVDKQETLEEVADKMLIEHGVKYKGEKIRLLEVKKLMVTMAKWQQERSYSKEEVLSLLMDFKDNIPNDVYVVDWFEKFKKEII